MKKFFKIILAIGAIGAGVAGGLFLYSKIKAKKNAAVVLPACTLPPSPFPS